MDNELLIKILIWSLIPISILFVIISFIAIYYFIKNKAKNVKIEDQQDSNNVANQNKQSVFKFMEFDNVEDSMIIQKKGNRFLMVIGCQGVNYDLMSAIEKNSVEEGFVQFLNTLRHPIQIYIQTRSINLEKSLQGYREKVKEVELKYQNMKIKYEQMKESENYSEQQLAQAYFELTKQANLCEYGNSIIQDTERMSLNKNILNKNFYIVIPYYSAEAGSDKLDKEEIKNIAFSELYTKAQSIINSISVCGVRGKVLRTNELIELLYMAYNRDEAETFGLEKALKAGFNELYSTGIDVYEKRIKELDKIIEEKAIEKAKLKVSEAKSEIQKRAEEKELNIEDEIAQIAKMIIEQNEEYLGTEVKDLAIEKIEETKEGGEENGKKTRGRKKSTST